MSQKVRPDYARLLRKMQDKVGGNQSHLARRIGVEQPTISRWMAGRQRPDHESHDRIMREARVLGVINTEGANDRAVPVVGYVQGGGEAILHADGQGPFDEAEMPPKGATEYTVAVVVRGNSMAGLADDGWLIYFDRRDEAPQPDMIGKLCVVGLPDGRVLVKKLLKGSGPDSYHLISIHGDPLLDQAVSWAAKVSWIQPQ